MKRNNAFKFAALATAAIILLLAGIFLFRSEPAATAQPVAAAKSVRATNASVAHQQSPVVEPTAAAQGIFLTPDVLWQKPITEETFARFHDWAERYRAAGVAERATLEAEGVDLAKARRKELAALIKSDPERALELTVPIGVRRELPAPVESLLEERVSGRGNFLVLGALAEPGKEDEVRPNIRTVQIGAREFDSYVYGWRLGEPTRMMIPLNGIAVDNLMAVSANSVRILEPEECSAAKAQVKEAVCSVSGQPADVIGEEVAADIGGEVTFFCRRLHAEKTNEQITAAEGGPPGPAADGGNPEASTWTEGLKKMILIRVDFPDLAGAPLSDTTATNLINNLNNFYTEMSYGRAGFYLNGNGSDFTPTFRMSQPAAYYGTNNYYNQLRTEARNAATAAGYVLGNYDRDVICMGAVPGFGWAGLAYVGSAGVWLRNSFGTGVAGHELGHNLGLNHANYWDTGGASVIGTGTSVEYGDSFDTMGSASAGNNHFNARYKNYLNWLTTSEVLTATTNGAYRITCHDNTNSTGIRGLKIVKNSQTNYWVEFRQKFTSNKWLTSGGGLRWAQSGNQKSQLLDTTPGSTDGKNDAAVVVGRTFSDKVSNVHITPIGKGGTSPESLDVVVNLGSFPGNQLPTLGLSTSATNAATGVTISFAATASDADGDALAYWWDFGDGSFATTNSAVANKSWSTAGEYLVRCVVSDMKGAVASQSIIVTIGSPTTYRIGGQILSGGTPLQGVRVYVSTTRMAYTDSDGTYTIVALPAGSYTVSASLENYSFAINGFTNPVSVGPNRTGANFDATFVNPSAPSITTQPINQTVNQGASATFSVVASGSTPLTYQWRFNGANIASATASSYTKSNVQSTNAGSYSVVVSNSFGTATSANAVLTVNTPPSIMSQPQGLSVIAGSTATFTVTASGTAPLAYQWRRSGTNVAGATTNSYSRTNAQPADAGSYTVVVTNSLGSVTSAPAALAVNYTLNASATAGGTVSKSPSQTNYAPGTLVTLTATPTSSFPFGNWSGNATGTNNPLTVTLTTNLVIVANFISPVADLIVDNPQASFTGTWATDTAAPDKFGADDRTAASTASTPSATATFTPNIATAGRYDVYAWWPTISKGAAAVPFLVSSSDGDVTVNMNQTSGSGSDWVLVTSGKMFAQGTNGFVRIGNNVGQGGKDVAADAVRWVYATTQDAAPPSISAQPTNQTVVLGSNAVFSVGAVGALPLNCQWRWNGGDIAGATNAALALNNVQTNDAGGYSVVVANSGGSVTSEVATLTVLVPPQILNPPQPLRVIEGSPATLDVTADGTAPLSYQWRFNAGQIAGATNSTFALSNALAANAGDYDVTISNPAGSATSLPATLVVSVRPILAPSFSNGIPQLTLTGTPGDSYALEISTNMMDWSEAATLTNLNGSVQFMDGAASTRSQQFYRARLIQ